MRDLLFCILCGMSMTLYSQTFQFQSVALSDSLISHADAVIRSDQLTVNIRSLNSMEVQKERVITVLNQRGNRLVRAFVGYDNSRKIKHIQATIYNALGLEVETIKKRDFKDVSAVQGGTLYSDSRIMYLDYTPLSYPYTVKFSYEIETSNTAPVPSWYFIENYRLSVEESSYQVTFAKPELRPEVKEYHLEGYPLVRKEQYNSLSFSITDVQAIQEEVLAPPFEAFVPHLKFRPIHFSYEGYEGEIHNWKDLGKWVYSNLLYGADNLPETTTEELNRLVLGVTDPIDRARIVYQYVQEHTRYISVQVGIGGLRPSSAEDVDELKYGDCKGLTNYTISLLRAVDVPAHYVHVQAGNPKLDFEADFADLSQGNHVILAIPNGEDGYVWADCTSQTIPFGFLGDFTDDRLAHIITEDGGSLARTPAYHSADNMQSSIAQMTLDSDGSLEGNVQIESYGIQYNARYSLLDLDWRDREVHYRDRWEHLTGLNLHDIVYEENKKEIKFFENVTFSTSTYAKKAGKRFFFAPNTLNRISHVPQPYEERKLPFEIRPGYLDKDSYKIQIPEKYVPEALPTAVNLETEFGIYRSEVVYDENQNILKYSREIEIRGGSYPEERYDAYREFRKEIAKAENAQAVFIESSNQ